MRKIKGVIWMIRTFGLKRWYRYEQVRREGRTINYGEVFSIDELDAWYRSVDQIMSNIEEWINDIGPGWQPLVRELDAELRTIDPDYTIEQVKEKFGGLRFYWSTTISVPSDGMGGIPDEHVGGEHAKLAEMNALVKAAEAKSYRICEECGAAPAETRTDIGGYWIKTKCARCRGEGK